MEPQGLGVEVGRAGVEVQKAQVEVRANRKWVCQVGVEDREVGVEGVEDHKVKVEGVEDLGVGVGNLAFRGVGVAILLLELEDQRRKLCFFYYQWLHFR